MEEAAVGWEIAYWETVVQRRPEERPKATSEDLGRIYARISETPRRPETARREILSGLISGGGCHEQRAGGEQGWVHS